jgi:hypothetical protein
VLATPVEERKFEQVGTDRLSAGAREVMPSSGWEGVESSISSMMALGI